MLEDDRLKWAGKEMDVDRQNEPGKGRL